MCRYLHAGSANRQHSETDRLANSRIGETPPTIYTAMPLLILRWLKSHIVSHKRSSHRRVTCKPNRKLLTVREAAAYLGVSKSWLDKQRLIGQFAPYVKIGRRRVGYDIADLDAATERAKRRSTSEQ